MNRAERALRVLTYVRVRDPELFARVQDYSQAAKNDLWDCLDCYNTDQLDENGRCTRCGSEALSPASVRRVS